MRATGATEPEACSVSQGRVSPIASENLVFLLVEDFPMLELSRAGS